ncbi:hypothetical protein Droror1_Dr00003946 [Drosera rotundifolia]
MGKSSEGKGERNLHSLKDILASNEQKKVSKRSNQSDSELSLKETENNENSSPKDTSDGTVEAETIEQDSGVDVGTLSEKVSIKAVPKKLKDLLDTGDALLAVVAVVVVIDLTLHYRYVSKEAKDLLRKMLCKNVSRWLSAEQVLVKNSCYGFGFFNECGVLESMRLLGLWELKTLRDFGVLEIECEVVVSDDPPLHIYRFQFKPFELMPTLSNPA